MSETVILAIVAAIPATVAAIAGINNGRKANAIHVLVNSKMTTALNNVADAKREIAALKEILATVTKNAGTPPPKVP